MTRLPTVCTPTSNVWECLILPNTVSKWCIPGEADVLVTILQMKKWCPEMLRHFFLMLQAQQELESFIWLSSPSAGLAALDRGVIFVSLVLTRCSPACPHIYVSHFHFTFGSFRLRRICKSVEVFHSDCDFNLAYWIQSKASTKIVGSVMSVKGW